jgi:hypothetical protein
VPATVQPPLPLRCRRRHRRETLGQATLLARIKAVDLAPQSSVVLRAGIPWLLHALDRSMLVVETVVCAALG